MQALRQRIPTGASGSCVSLLREDVNLPSMDLKYPMRRGAATVSSVAYGSSMCHGLAWHPVQRYCDREQKLRYLVCN